MPENARSDPAGLRWYRWEPADGEPTDVLSVTSIRNACGQSINLVNWQIANLVNAATGTRRVERIGPRGGVRKAYEPDGEFPGEFVRQLLETEGSEAKIAVVRSWLKEAAESPRDVAALRGSVVHKAIEEDELSPTTDWITERFADEGRGRNRRTKIVPVADDFIFVQRTLGQYRDFTEKEPGQILAREPQVWNLTLGYAGSLDTIREVMYEGRMVRAVIDYKTSADLHTDNVLQVHGYMGAEFVGSNGVVDEELTEMLAGVTHGGLLHLRPDGWGLHLFPFNAEVMQAYVGSVMLARLIADYVDPKHLFAESRNGRTAR